MATDILDPSEVDLVTSLPLVQKSVLEGHTAAVASVKFNSKETCLLFLTVTQRLVITWSQLAMIKHYDFGTPTVTNLSRFTGAMAIKLLTLQCMPIYMTSFDFDLGIIQTLN